jgi:hypothetical protein
MERVQRADGVLHTRGVGVRVVEQESLAQQTADHVLHRFLLRGGERHAIQALLRGRFCGVNIACQLESGVRLGMLGGYRRA